MGGLSNAVCHHRGGQTGRLIVLLRSPDLVLSAFLRAYCDPFFFHQHKCSIELKHGKLWWYLFPRFLLKTKRSSCSEKNPRFVALPLGETT